MDERLMMVDAEGWAATSDPVYYDLYIGDGTMRRFLATDMTGALGSLVSFLLLSSSGGELLNSMEGEGKEIRERERKKRRRRRVEKQSE